MENKAKIVLGGKIWYYENVANDGESQIVLYGENGEALSGFSDADEMSAYLMKEASKGKQDAQSEIQGNFMRNIQKLKGEMNDAEFAGFLGMKYDTVYQYMIGRRFPTVYALSQIAEKCNVTMDWLISKAC